LRTQGYKKNCITKILSPIFEIIFEMLHKIAVKSVLNKHKKRDSWFLDDYSVNPYESCSFNCIYCYIRSSKYGKKHGKRIQKKLPPLY